MKKSIAAQDRIIFALDVSSKEEALGWLDRLEGHVHFYKVGLQLFMAQWFTIVDEILSRGHQVMVDLKFFDIPETVSLAVTELAKQRATFITVHGNEPILRAAIAARKDSKILAVTVLTSFDETDMRDMGLSGSIEDLVYLRAKKALQMGCDGVVSSGLEVPRLRNGLGDELLVVTPGIRPGANTLSGDDQKRVSSAFDALRAGADYVVVGRPIRDAQDPVRVVKMIQDDIDRALR